MNDSNMDVRDALKIVFKRLWVLLPVTVVCLAGALLTLSFLTPLYESSVRFVVAGIPKVDSPYYDQMLPVHGVSMAATNGEIVKSQDILRQVVTALKLDEREEKAFFSTPKLYALRAMDKAMDYYDAADRALDLLMGKEPKTKRPVDPLAKMVEKLDKRILAESVDKTDVLRVSVRDYDPQTAADIGNALARYYVLFLLKQQAAQVGSRYGDKHPLMQQISDDIARVQATLSTPASLASADMLGSEYVKIVQNAYPPTKPVKPNKKLILIGSLTGALIGGFLLMFLLEQLDPTFRGSAEVRRLTGAPIIGAVPTRLWWRRDAAAALMPLARQIHALRTTAGARTICLSAVDSTASNAKLAQGLALCLGRVERSSGAKKRGVLLVEPSFNGGKILGRAVDLGSRASVGDFLRGRSQASHAIHSIDETLAVTALEPTNGSPAPFGKDRYRDFFDTAAADFQAVLVQAPVASGTSSAGLMDSACDSTILVVNDGRTRRKAVESLLASFAANKVKVLGVIINDQKRPLPGFLYNLV